MYMYESDNIYISYVTNVISLYRNSSIRRNIDIIHRRNNLESTDVITWKIDGFAWMFVCVSLNLVTCVFFI